MSVSEAQVLSGFERSDWSNGTTGTQAAPGIRRAQFTASDTRQAAREFHAGVAHPDTALVMFFCSVQYDLDLMASELQRLFVGVQVVGCTTAGEIGPSGYLDHSITGVSFPPGSFKVVSGAQHQLHQFEPAQAQNLTQHLLRQLDRAEPLAGGSNTFAYLLIDGPPVRAEKVSRAVQNGLGRIPVLGGSSGDGRQFTETCVCADGAFRTGSAVLVLISTMLPFRTFKTDHFVPTDDRVVVTRADADRRVVYEIDGRPAAEAYAQLVGVPVAELTVQHYAECPMVVMIAGTKYLRAIRSANADGSLTFYCAIEEGLVLRAARGVGLAEKLEDTFVEIETAIGRPQLVMGCDCILRKVEAKFRGLVGQSLVGIVLIEDGRFTYSNARFDDMFGYSEPEIRERGPLELTVPNDREFVADNLRRRLTGAIDRTDFVFRGLRKNGEVLDAECRSTVMQVGGRRMLISMVLDISTRAAAEREILVLQEQLREESTHDSLTGLYNRRFLDASFARELTLAERSGEPVSVIMCDLDHFKRVNDRYGHQAGDEVLRAFGELMKQHARASDIFYRYVAEDFLMVLLGLASEGALERAEQLRSALAKLTVEHGDGRIRVTASFGVATFPADGRSSDALIAAADGALYTAKAARRNQAQSGR
ncbi:diguanylate cyclase [Cryobacterium sp. TMT2-23]|uniref:diguanylate cyclase n=1 Tax=Cryobacterium sp. TMT2-23 TaxID=1259252 RepID=UPI00141AAE0F|nr:diguanylate cyclase [Cryobacterium sp. TMT2-23]